MTLKVRLARLGFVSMLCVGLAFSLDGVRKVHADCTGTGATCETLCPAGYSQIYNNCLIHDGLWVDSVGCNACSFPGQISGLCNDFTQVGATCF
jgi:hypothetical protein